MVKKMTTVLSACCLVIASDACANAQPWLWGQSTVEVRATFAVDLPPSYEDVMKAKRALEEKEKRGEYVDELDKLALERDLASTMFEETRELVLSHFKSSSMHSSDTIDQLFYRLSKEAKLTTDKWKVKELSQMSTILRMNHEIYQRRNEDYKNKKAEREQGQRS